MAEKRFGKLEIKVDKPLATSVLKLKVRLLNYIGDGVERLPEILHGRRTGATAEDQLKSNAAAVAAFTDIASNLDPDDFVSLVNDVLSKALIKRPSGAYEEVLLDNDFSENMGQLYPVLIFILNEVFADFFTEIKARFKAYQDKMEAEEQAKADLLAKTSNE